MSFSSTSLKDSHVPGGIPDLCRDSHVAGWGAYLIFLQFKNLPSENKQNRKRALKEVIVVGVVAAFLILLGLYWLLYSAFVPFF
jgi:hypothetical protein